MSQSTKFALLSRLRKVVATDNMEQVADLDVETNDAGAPRRITGYILVPGTNGMRKEPCSWLPNGRHRLHPELNLTIPEA